MSRIKLTTWNIEHLGRLLPTPPAGREAKLRGVIEEIRELDPEILCINEAPSNLLHLLAWVNSPEGLGGRYHVPTIPGTEEILQQDPPDPRRALQQLYAMQGNATSGSQWIWFLVRDGLYQESGARLLNPRVWRDLTRQASWPVRYWGQLAQSRHSHWRHPQTLVLRLGGREVEIIGVHLKSKINTLAPFDAEGQLTQAYVEEALRARVRLATEAYDMDQCAADGGQPHQRPRTRLRAHHRLRRGSVAIHCFSRIDGLAVDVMLEPALPPSALVCKIVHGVNDNRSARELE